MKQAYINGRRIVLYDRVSASEISINKMVEIIGEQPEFIQTYAATNYVYATPIPCGFDIEDYHGFMYAWTLTINTTTILGRTWEEFIQVLDVIKVTLGLGKRFIKSVKHTKDDKEGKWKKGDITDEYSAPYVLPIFIHHIPHEWSFMKHWINADKIFYMDKEDRNPMYVLSDGILFLDSYKIFPKRLEDVAESYCITQKTHDLDYDTPRSYKTPLTEKEIQYCCNDTRILVEIAQMIFDNWFLPYKKIPMTQNQIIKILLNYEYKEYLKSKSDAEVEKIEKALRNLTLKQYQYDMFRVRGFRSGWCQSSECDTKEMGITRIAMDDLNSAYMTGIAHGYYPMGSFTPYKNPTMKSVERCCKTMCCYMKLKIYNLKSKSFVKLESKDKVTRYMPDGSKPRTTERGTLIEEDRRVLRKTCKTNSSGRIYKAGCITVVLNEIDWELYHLVYTWDKVEVLSLETATRGPLPDYVKKTAFKLYKRKSELKKARLTKTPEYITAKTLVSNVFGCIVQRIDNMIVNGEESKWWATQLDKILKPQWGCYITSHVRKLLIEVVLAVGVDSWLYSDTDSLYFALNDRTEKVIALHNLKMKALNAEMCKQYNLDYSLFDDLGCFDDEDKKIHRFKTLGAKTYLYWYTDNDHPYGDFNYTVSGIPEQFFWEAYSKKYPVWNIKDKEKAIDTVFDFFEGVSEIYYTKNVVKYIDEYTEEIIDGTLCKSYSGCIIETKDIHAPMSELQEIAAIEEAFSSMKDTIK